MSRRPVVLGGVLRRRRIATADMSAERAAAQMHPPTIGGVALDTTSAAGRHLDVDLVSNVVSHDGDVTRPGLTGSGVLVGKVLALPYSSMRDGQATASTRRLLGSPGGTGHDVAMPPTPHHEVVPTSIGPIEVTSRHGDGPTVLFIHGFLVDETFWDDVVPHLDGLNIVTPCLPLGSHRRHALPDADLSLAGVARAVADVMDALDLRDVVVVGADYGGAVA